MDEPTRTAAEQHQARLGVDPVTGVEVYLLRMAIEHVVNRQVARVSGLQRKLRVGFVTANRLMFALEARGVVGPAPDREVLVKREGLAAVLRDLPTPSRMEGSP